MHRCAEQLYFFERQKCKNFTKYIKRENVHRWLLHMLNFVLDYFFYFEAIFHKLDIFFRFRINQAVISENYYEKMLSKSLRSVQWRRAACTIVVIDKIAKKTLLLYLITKFGLLIDWWGEINFPPQWYFTLPTGIIIINTKIWTCLKGKLMISAHFPNIFQMRRKPTKKGDG